MNQLTGTVDLGGITLSGPVAATEIAKGDGFSARQFRREQFGGLMDPFIMVDDYTMTEPTFGEHPHAGIAAISVLFEQTQGLFYNHDSLDNHLALRAGDLYWLNAGSGAMHDESPLPNQARVRGLQMFLKLPSQASTAPPSANHVSAEDIPTLEQPGVRVRVVAGQTHGIAGFNNAVAPATILDSHFEPGGRFDYTLEGDHAAWLYVVDGEVNVVVDGHKQAIHSGKSVAIRNQGGDKRLALESVRPSHMVLVSSALAQEAFVNHGPFALKDCGEIAQAQAAARSGRMGRVERKPVTNLT